MNSNLIAKVVYAALSKFDELSHRPTVEWEGLTDEVRNTYVTIVDNRSSNLNKTSEDYHNEWVRSMQADGWVYGPEYSTAFKEHPDLVRYQRLPEVVQKKDRLMMAMIDTLLT
jgi:hypothetical protein